MKILMVMKITGCGDCSVARCSNSDDEDISEETDGHEDNWWW